MSLRFIIGPSGSGKSRRLFQTAICRAHEDRGRQYLILVPEQFTMQTQQELCSLSPEGGILNINILSFSRLAVFVFSETGVRKKTLLKETGKSLLLRLIADREASGLSLLSGVVDRPGVLGELKSILSEMDQYEISDDDMRSMISECEDHPVLAGKLDQLSKLREKYRQYQEERGLQTIETVPEALCAKIPESKMLRGSSIFLDGYTGFTPAQLDILACLMRKAADITVTVTMDPDQDLYGEPSEDELFSLSKKTIRALTRLAQDTGTPIVRPLFLSRDGPSRFRKGSQLGYLEEHLFRPGRKKPMPQVPEDAPGQVRFLSCRSPLEEAEAAVTIIRQLTRTGGEKCLRYRDIAVVVGDFNTYAEYLRRVFTDAKIPFFVDRTVPVTLNPAFEFVKDAIAIPEGGYSYESMMAFFRTGFVFDDRETADTVENYLLAAGIRGHRAWENPWTRPADGFPEESLGQLEEIRADFARKFEPFADVFRHSSGRLKDYAAALWQMMDAFSVQQKLSRLSKEREDRGMRADAEIYGQAASVIAGVLDEAVSLLGEETVKRQQFEQILEAGFAEARIGIIPPGTDEVHIGDLTRSRLTNVKAILFLGMNDDFVPARKKAGGVLTDMERNYLREMNFALAPSAREDAAIQKFYLYLCLSKPSDLLVLSWSRMGGDGTIMHPSSVLRQIRELLPDIPAEEGIPGGISSMIYLPEEAAAVLADAIAESRNWSSQERDEKTPALRELYLSALALDSGGTLRLLKTLAPPVLPKLSGKIARLLYGEVLEGSVSRLEKFAQCPFQQYAVYGLGLEERSRFEVRASDVGSLMHRAMEILSEKVDRSREYSWKKLPEEVCALWAEECLKEAALEKSGGRFEDTFRSQGQFQRLLRIFRHSAEIMRLQLAAGSFRPALYEARFDSSDHITAEPLIFDHGGQMRLTGRIDRIDEAVDGKNGMVYVKVMDYKTGSTKFDLKQVYAGTELQLLVYMDSAVRMERQRHRDQSVLCAGILYFPVSDPVLGTDHSGNGPEVIELQRMKAVRPDGLVLDDPEVISRLADDPARLPYVAPVTLNKDGTPSKTSGTASRDQFSILSDFAGCRMKEIGEAIYNGEIAPAPLRENDRLSACTWCPVKSVCRFSEQDPLMKYRELQKGGKDKVWQLIEEKVDQES